jgi:hypothetical protein
MAAATKRAAGREHLGCTSMCRPQYSDVVDRASSISTDWPMRSAISRASRRPSLMSREAWR